MSNVPPPFSRAPTLHFRDAREEALLERFRESYVDLGEKVTRVGRGIRDMLIAELEDLSGTYGFPIVIRGSSFGAGSFGRRTQHSPLDDIDIYLVLNSGGIRMHDSGSVWVLEGETAGPATNDMALRSGIWISADLVLQRVAERLPSLPLVGTHGARCGVNTKRKSAFIKFPGGLNVDVSPVFWARFADAIDRYYMPLGNGSPFWKATNPKEDQRRLSDLNQGRSGLLLPSIRMLKWWNANMNGGRLKGIHLEVMAERALAAYLPSGLAEAVHMEFASICDQLGSPCADPTGLGPALDQKLTWAERSASTAAASRAHRDANVASAMYLLGDEAGGRKAWDQVFPGI